MGSWKLGRRTEPAVVSIIGKGEHVAGIIESRFVQLVLHAVRIGLALGDDKAGNLIGTFDNIFSLRLPELGHLWQKLH